ncbi:MAG: hypothetical protein M5R40_17370 [Anaerolineae bacterium]|nr:hypothetical protein [Anaerolineae bacterium]
MLLLTRTALIVVFIFEFKAIWTDLIKPLIYLYDNVLAASRPSRPVRAGRRARL